jgi:hypothetical protein
LPACAPRGMVRFYAVPRGQPTRSGEGPAAPVGRGDVDRSSSPNAVKARNGYVAPRPLDHSTANGLVVVGRELDGLRFGHREYDTMSILHPIWDWYHDAVNWPSSYRRFPGCWMEPLIPACRRAGLRGRISEWGAHVDIAQPIGCGARIRRCWVCDFMHDSPTYLVPPDVCASLRILHLVLFGCKGPPPGSPDDPRAVSIAARFQAAGLAKHQSSNKGQKIAAAVQIRRVGSSAEP